MKEELIKKLRNRSLCLEDYHKTAEELAKILAIESSHVIPKEHVILVPILRSGLAMLYPFLQLYPNAPIGLIGTIRDEKTAKPSLYYVRLPEIDENRSILLLDPMLATGGSSTLAIQILKEAGAKEEKITLVAFFAAKEGILYFQNTCPKARLIIAQVDEKLDANFRIVPGCGDFGDRYFGTSSD